MHSSQCLWSFGPAHGKRNKALGRCLLPPYCLHQHFQLILQGIRQLIHPPLALCCQCIQQLVHRWGRDNTRLGVLRKQMPDHQPRCTRTLTYSVPRPNATPTFTLSYPLQYLLLPRVRLNLQHLLNKQNRVPAIAVKKLLNRVLKTHFSPSSNIIQVNQHPPLLISASGPQMLHI